MYIQASVTLVQPLSRKVSLKSLSSRRSQPGKKSLNAFQPSQDQNPTQHTQHIPTASLDIGYFLRSIEGIGPLLHPLEDSIRQQFLPALTGRDISDTDRKLLALPAHYGGLGLINPTAMSEKHAFSMRWTALLTVLIVQQNSDLGDAPQQQQAIKTTLRAERCKSQDEAATELKSGLPQQLQRVAELGSERGPTVG